MPGFKYLWERHTLAVKMTHATARVAWVLAIHANGDGTHAHPGVARLHAETTIANKQTITDALAWLRKAGYIEHNPDPCPASRRSGRPADCYRLTLPHDPGAACPVCHPGSAVTSDDHSPEMTTHLRSGQVVTSGDPTRPSHQTRSFPAGVITGTTATSNGDGGRERRALLVAAARLAEEHAAACRPPLRREHRAQFHDHITEWITRGDDPADVSYALAEWRAERERSRRNPPMTYAATVLENRGLAKLTDGRTDPADVAVICGYCGAPHRDTDPCPG
jgi:hypothetical protein